MAGAGAQSVAVVELDLESKLKLNVIKTGSCFSVKNNIFFRW